MNELFLEDYKRFTQKKYARLTCLLRLIKNYELRFLYILRKYQTSSIGGGYYYSLLSHYRRKYGVEIVCKNIGAGLRLIHPWGITVNSNAYLGNNVTLYKGVTIGVIAEGDKRGNPQIGDNCTLYANCTVCGNIKVGANSEIAAGAFVNFDVPEDSIVIGNPGIIHKKQMDAL